MAVEAIRGWMNENINYEMNAVLSCIGYRIYDMACEELKA